jgi:hypothetical protein
MNDLEVVRGSERAYVADENGVPLDAERRVRPSPELRDEELARAERLLTPVIARGEAAEERLAAEELRRLREPGKRQFAEQDPDASRAENQLYAQLAAWRRGA